jgi:hypothetical protein
MTSVVPRDSDETAAPHFLELVAARLAHVFGAGGPEGDGAAAAGGLAGAEGAAAEEAEFEGAAVVEGGAGERDLSEVAGVSWEGAEAVGAGAAMTGASGS